MPQASLSPRSLAPTRGGPGWKVAGARGGDSRLRKSLQGGAAPPSWAARVQLAGWPRGGARGPEMAERHCRAGGTRRAASSVAPARSGAVPRQLLVGKPCWDEGERARGTRAPGRANPQPKFLSPPSAYTNAGPSLGFCPTQDLGAQPLALALQRGQTQGALTLDGLSPLYLNGRPVCSGMTIWKRMS